jgi:hypothetical protein
LTKKWVIVSIIALVVGVFLVVVIVAVIVIVIKMPYNLLLLIRLY